MSDCLLDATPVLRLIAAVVFYECMPPFTTVVRVLGAVVGLALTTVSAFIVHATSSFKNLSKFGALLDNVHNNLETILNLLAT